MSIAVGLLEAVHENYCSRVVLLDTTAYAESGPVETQLDNEAGGTFASAYLK